MKKDSAYGAGGRAPARRAGGKSSIPRANVSATLSAVANGKNVYSVNLNVLKEGYTLVGREVFKYGLTAPAFILYIAVPTDSPPREAGSRPCKRARF